MFLSADTEFGEHQCVVAVWTFDSTMSTVTKAEHENHIGKIVFGNTEPHEPNCFFRCFLLLSDQFLAFLADLEQSPLFPHLLTGSVDCTKTPTVSVFLLPFSTLQNLGQGCTFDDLQE